MMSELIGALKNSNETKRDEILSEISLKKSLYSGFSEYGIDNTWTLVPSVTSSDQSRKTENCFNSNAESSNFIQLRAVNETHRKVNQQYMVLHPWYHFFAFKAYQSREKMKLEPMIKTM